MGGDDAARMLDLRATGLNGLECQELLESVNITANRNVVPFEEGSFNVASGLRVGSRRSRRAASWAGWRTGELMLRAISARDDDAALREIRHGVVELLDRFPLYEFL
jgi:glycine hydroxymethyltransferase